MIISESNFMVRKMDFFLIIYFFNFPNVLNFWKVLLFYFLPKKNLSKKIDRFFKIVFILIIILIIILVITLTILQQLNVLFVLYHYY